MVAVAEFGEGEEESKRTFVQTLFNRLMFVYFLSRKGWLRFGNNADYLTALWQGYGKGLRDGNFPRARLRRRRINVLQTIGVADFLHLNRFHQFSPQSVFLIILCRYHGSNLPSGSRADAIRRRNAFCIGRPSRGLSSSALLSPLPCIVPRRARPIN